MKIELEFSKFQIHFISNQMELFETGLADMNFNIQPKDKKLILSICSDISEKFHNKSQSINKEFKPRKKPYKFILKWYQGYALNVLWLCEDFRLRMRNLSDKPKTQQVQTKN